MKCCSNCFTSNYLQSYIISISKHAGNCDFCGVDNAPVLDPSELIIFFRNIFDLYTSSNTSIVTIEQQILIDFPHNIFKINNEKIIRDLLMAISESEKEFYTDLFENHVLLKSYSAAKDLELSWNNFVDEIKNENRFHIKSAIDLNILKTLLRRHSIEISKKQSFLSS